MKVEGHVYCEACGGVTHGFGLYGCKEPCHPTPDLAMRIVLAIEKNLDGRRGFGIYSLEGYVLYELRYTLAQIVRKELETP